MICNILSDKFPSMQHCNVHVADPSDVAADQEDDGELLVPSCPNICCTGAFIQEGMMGVIMSAEVSYI